jgi:hypothetical protein
MPFSGDSVLVSMWRKIVDDMLEPSQLGGFCVTVEYDGSKALAPNATDYAPATLQRYEAEARTLGRIIASLMHHESIGLPALNRISVARAFASILEIQYKLEEWQVITFARSRVATPTGVFRVLSELMQNEDVRTDEIDGLFVILAAAGALPAGVGDKAVRIFPRRLGRSQSEQGIHPSFWEQAYLRDRVGLASQIEYWLETGVWTSSPPTWALEALAEGLNEGNFIKAVSPVRAEPGAD